MSSSYVRDAEDGTLSPALVLELEGMSPEHLRSLAAPVPRRTPSGALEDRFLANMPLFLASDGMHPPTCKGPISGAVAAAARQRSIGQHPELLGAAERGGRRPARERVRGTRCMGSSSLQ